MFKIWTISYSTWVSNWLLNNLISYYKADTNGSFPDAHWSNDWTINWATYTASWKINWAYSFDWINDYISLNIWAWWEFNWTDFTINIWFKSDWITQTWFDYILWFSNWGGLSSVQFYHVATTNYLHWYIRDNWWAAIDIDTWVSPFDQNWHMYTMTWDYTTWTLEMFIDGISKWTGINTNISLAWTHDLWIWALNNAWITGWAIDWNMDEVCLWDRGLSSDDITALYNSTNWLSYDNFTT